MKQQSSHSLTVCMGSSCFAHGNQEIIEHIQNFLKEHSLMATVDLKGSLCQNKCKDGPSMIVDGKVYTRLTVEKAILILRNVFSIPQEIKA